MDAPEIVVSAVVVRDELGHILVVRKRGTTRFMLPGGKPEPGEGAAATAAREFAEELGVDIREGDLTPMGEYVSAAANEAGHTVRADVFAHPHVTVGDPQAEIAELRWLDPGDLPDHDTLAPLFLDVLAELTP